jgi:hypothetical protein
VAVALLAAPAGAGAISLGKAEKIALRTLKPGRHALVYRWTSVLGSRSVVGEPGPGRLQAGRTRLQRLGGVQTLVTPLSRRRIGHRAYMFWKDLEPQAALPHPNVLLLLDARSGRVLKRTSIAWWPVVNGRPNGRSARVGGGPVVRVAGTIKSGRPVRARAAAASQSRVIEVGDFNTPDSIPDFNAVSAWAVKTTGNTPYRALNVGGLEYAINAAAAQGSRDIVIYVSGHQFVPVGFLDILGRAGDAFAHRFAGKPPGPYVSLSSSPGFGHSWKQQILTAEELKGAIAAAKTRYPDIKTTVIVETCGAGNFGPVLRGTADQIITSVDAQRFTLAPPRDGGPSAFTNAVITDATSALGYDGSLSLGGAIAQAAPAIGRTTEALAAQQDGGYYPQDPTYTTQNVSGLILTHAACPAEYAFVQPVDPLYCDPPRGLIAVELGIAFTLDTGSTGTITISPPGRTVDPTTPLPSFGNPAIGDVFFYVTPGTAVKLTANHGANSFFDGWQVENGGRCVPPTGTPSGQIDGGSPGICTFTVQDEVGARRFFYDARAFFLKCPPPGKYLGLRKGEKIDCPGVTEGP